VQKSTEDEVGLLVDAFNEMLNEIGKRSRALEESNKALAYEADERRAAEDALRQLNETLAERIAARTAELEHAHEQLRQAQKMEAIGQLTGGIAHDFNNILAVMSGNVEIMQLLQSQQKGADIGRYLASTMKSVERAAALTHRLLAFSRRQALDPRPTDVNRLIVSMADLVRSTVGPAINVSTHLAGDLWHTICDQHQLENALLNLVINARDAMPQGGRLTITTANVAQDERPAGMKQVNCIVMSVADSGTGMPPDVLKRAFDPFFTTKPQGQGTGLGLSMVYGFVSQSGGDVQITSAPGEGTTVRIYLPARQDAGIPEEPAAVVGEHHRPAADSTILVVDDESDIRGMIVERLSEQGYTVLQAEDGPKALQVLASAPQVELLVTDIGLPGGMNGRQLADRVRRERENIKVLLITGYADVGVVGNSQLEFGTELMTKPFRMEAFVDKVRSMTDGDSMTVA
jgi:signal transduction histidine kinase/ActR/RegA family two-component response regulator